MLKENEFLLTPSLKLRMNSLKKRPSQDLDYSFEVYKQSKIKLDFKRAVINTQDHSIYSCQKLSQDLEKSGCFLDFELDLEYRVDLDSFGETSREDTEEVEELVDHIQIAMQSTNYGPRRVLADSSKKNISLDRIENYGDLQ
jgi:KaiC/GvpD/RAD55 family RecA-like ATPase